MTHLRFSKLHSNGNDFVLIDRIANFVPDELVLAHTQQITNRHTGIGADGIILVDPPSKPDIDFTYRIINASGEEICQCGNGAICFSHYIAMKFYSTKKTISVEVCGRVMLLTRSDCATMTLVNMGRPSFLPETIPCLLEQPTAWTRIEVAGHVITGSAVSMGNPHFVSRVDDVDAAPVVLIGSALQEHDLFPEQVNAVFMQIVDERTIHLRVFERGVGETYACGSGACAAVVVGYKHGLLARTVAVHTAGGEARVTYDEDESVYYASRAVHVFSGTIQLS